MAGAYLIATDKTGWGAGLITGDATAVIGLFIYSKESQKQERQTKGQEQKERLNSVAKKKR